MAAESNHVIGLDHFDGGGNLQTGTSKSLSVSRGGQTLAQLLRKVRSGRFTAGGAGDTVVTFDVQLESANYSILLTGDGVSAPVIKTGSTPTAAGFTVTAAGAGPVHWFAFEDGPTS